VKKVRGRGLVLQRYRMVECTQKEGATEASRHFGVSRPTPYKLMARYDEKGIEGLLNRDHGGQNRVPKEVEEAVVEENDLPSKLQRCGRGRQFRCQNSLVE